jgi:hypothetical protein
MLRLCWYNIRNPLEILQMLTSFGIYIFCTTCISSAVWSLYDPPGPPWGLRGNSSSRCDDFCLVNLDVVYFNIQIHILTTKQFLGPLRDPQGVIGPPKDPQARL